MIFRLLNSFLTLVVLLCCTTLLSSQQNIYQKIQQNEFEIVNEPLQNITKKISDTALEISIPKSVLKYKQFYELKELAFENIKTGKQPNLRILFPVENQLVEFHLVKAKLFTPDFVAVTNGQNIVDVNKGTHYWGIAKNDANSLIALSVFDTEVVASIQLNNQSYTFSRYENTDYHILFKNSDFNFQPDFTCETIGLRDGIISFDPNMEKSDPNDCVRIHVEADYGLYQSKGSSINNTTNYVNGLFNQVAVMYANESINIAISYLNIWTSTSPYVSGNELNDLVAQNYGRIHGDLVHLLHRNGGGGVAYLDVLCDNTLNAGVSGINGNFNNVPTYSWDVFVVSHELGHNMGSPHTHDCAWNGNSTAIDGCGYQSSGGTDGCPAPIPTLGTVMSYCHIINGIDFTLGFGQQPGDLMRNRVANANCLSICAPPDCFDGYQNGDEDGIDCGGANCPACPSCNDGILNQDETSVDCGGANCPACPCAGGVGVSLIINPDFYISETTWNFTDASGNVVASGGGYTNGQGTTVEAICLPPGCYDFTIFDSYGDGLFDGARTGNYIVIDENGNNLATGSGNFGPSETTNICVNASCTSIDMNILFDGFPGQSSWDITDANGNVVATGGTYGSQSPNSSYTTAAGCLPDGCYTLNFNDALGNGMCPFQSSAVGVSTFITPGTLITPGSIVGTLSLVATPGLCGNYNLTDANGNILVSGGGAFGSQQSTDFCLSGTSNSATCSLPMDIGPCDGLCPRWYYDGATQDCLQFMWGCCDGNANNFESYQMCITACDRPLVGLAPRLSNESQENINKVINNNFSVQPNPVLNRLNIYTGVDISANTQLQIINVLGEVVLDKKISKNDFNSISLDVEHLLAGTYFAVLKDNTQIMIEKFLKQ